MIMIGLDKYSMSLIKNNSIKISLAIHGINYLCHLALDSLFGRKKAATFLVHQNKLTLIANVSRSFFWSSISLFCNGLILTRSCEEISPRILLFLHLFGLDDLPNYS